MLLQTGDHVDRYQVEYFVGRGGLAEVYAVRHRVLETRHALKVLKRAHPEQVKRLILEGRVQARIDHPNIVPVRDVFDVGASPALLMPLVDGPALLQVLAARPLTVAEAGALLRGIVAGVGHIHHHDLVHRDIKPGNVLLEVRGRRLVPRVSDFGLVKEVRLDMRRTASAGFLGTPAYAAPEQLQAKQDIDARADIWSLGVLLFEMLTGELPFNARGLLALSAEETMISSPPPPRPKGLSDGWYALLCDLLETKVERRLQSAGEVQTRLDELMVPVAGDAEALLLRSPLGGTVLPIRHAMASRRPATLDATPMPAPTVAPEPPDAGPRPTQTAPGVRDNLPQPLDRFVGRTHELRDLHELLNTERLVTITGAAGTGKTRISVELGARVARDRVGDVCFVPITACASDESIARAVASALDVPMTRDSQVAVVERELEHRGVTLLIIDNAEQAVEPTAFLCQRWLDALPGLRIVVTSRMPIALPGEAV
ncbi:MAG: serine/threonine protein kinase, partial [Bradymonadia bacterium]